MIYTRRQGEIYGKLYTGAGSKTDETGHADCKTRTITRFHINAIAVSWLHYGEKRGGRRPGGV